MIAIISGMCAVARGSISGGSAPSAAMSAWKSAVVRAVSASIGMPSSPGARVDLVLDVGDVPHIGDMRIELAQQPRQHVEHHHGPRIADMHQVVDRRPAHVHPDVVGIERHEPLLPARQAVVQEKRVHGSIGPLGVREGMRFLRQTLR